MNEQVICWIILLLIKNKETSSHLSIGSKTILEGILKFAKEMNSVHRKSNRKWLKRLKVWSPSLIIRLIHIKDDFFLPIRYAKIKLFEIYSVVDGMSKQVLSYLVDRCELYVCMHTCRHACAQRTSGRIHEKPVIPVLSNKSGRG